MLVVTGSITMWYWVLEVVNGSIVVGYGSSYW